MNKKREVRYQKSQIELRDGKTPIIAGYAAVFAPARSENLGGFVEELDPHCFDDTVGGDVRALWNHNADCPLGRTKSGTMRLSLDAKGLRYEIDVPDTQLGRDLVVSMRRGDVDSSSFGFICQEDRWDTNSTPAIRTVLKAELFDVSPVVYPAYPDATSAVRSLFPDGMIDVPEKRDDNADTVGDKAGKCECACEKCAANLCDECNNPDCDDEYCCKRAADPKDDEDDGERSRMMMRVRVAKMFDIRAAYAQRKV